MIKRQFTDLAGVVHQLRWVLCAACALGVVLLPAAAAFGQEFPARAINLILPLPPGSAVETQFRLIAPEAAKKLGQPIVVENRPGAGGKIGVSALINSKNDGHVIGMGYIGPLVVLAVGDAGFHIVPQKDYLPVVLVSQAPLVLVAHPSAPFRDLQGMISYAKRNPGKLTVSGSARGSSAHLGFELLRSMTGIDFVLVNYQGEVQATPSLINGEVQALIAASSIKPHVDSGKAIALATTGMQRWSMFPSTPTFNEAGVKGFEIAGWYGIIAPVGTPAIAISKLNAAFNAAIANPEITKVLRSSGLTPIGSTPDEFSQRIRSDLDRIGPVITKAGLKFD